MSNSVETATRWCKPEEYFSPIDVYISKTVRNALKHFYFCIALSSKTISGAVVEMVEYRLPPSPQSVTPSYKLPIVLCPKVKDDQGQ